MSCSVSLFLLWGYKHRLLHYLLETFQVFFVFSFLAVTMFMGNFPNQDSNLQRLQWKRKAQSFNEWTTREVQSFSVLTPMFYLPPTLITGNELLHTVWDRVKVLIYGVLWTSSWPSMIYCWVHSVLSLFLLDCPCGATVFVNQVLQYVFGLSSPFLLFVGIFLHQ